MQTALVLRQLALELAGAQSERIGYWARTFAELRRPHAAIGHSVRAIRG